MDTAADPPSLEQVFVLFQNASSQDGPTAQAASQLLDTYKTIPGFFQSVQTIAAERNLPLDVRKQAIFQFKNNAPLLWRRAA